MGTIGSRIQELIDYLDITYNKFAVECGITANHSIHLYIIGELSPSIDTIKKIRKRYPVRMEWLIMGEGEMWVEDYYESRFKKLRKNVAEPSKKINILLEVFEQDMASFGRQVGITRKNIHDIMNGKFGISERNRKRIITRYPFIDEEFLLN